MNLKLPQLLAAAAGAVLLYAATKNVSPIAVAKAVLTGSPMPTGPTGDPIADGTKVVDGNGNPTGGVLGSDGKYYAPNDNRLPQPQPSDPSQQNVQEGYQNPYPAGDYRVVSV